MFGERVELGFIREAERAHLFVLSPKRLRARKHVAAKRTAMIWEWELRARDRPTKNKTSFLVQLRHYAFPSNHARGRFIVRIISYNRDRVAPQQRQFSARDDGNRSQGNARRLRKKERRCKTQHELVRSRRELPKIHVVAGEMKRRTMRNWSNCE